MKRFIILISIFAVILCGCAQKLSPDDKVLAKISSRDFTLGDFKAKIAKLPLYYQTVIEKNRKRYLDDIIVETLFYEEGIRQGLNRTREIKEVISEARKKIIIAKLIENEVEKKIVVPESEMKEFYDAHKDEFKTPPLWRASHILVADELQAKDILIRLSKGESFEELAKRSSTDATASRGGDIGYFRVGQLVPDFEKACIKLKIGETSDIVHTQFGYHIIRLTGKKEPAVMEFKDVEKAIASELKRKKRSELFDKLVKSLKNKYGVKIKEDVFKTLGSLDKETDKDEAKGQEQK